MMGELLRQHAIERHVIGREQEMQQAATERVQPCRQIPARDGIIHHCGGEMVGLFLHHLLEQRLLVGEAVVDGDLRNARARGNMFDRGSVEAALQKGVQRRVHDRLVLGRVARPPRPARRPFFTRHYRSSHKLLAVNEKLNVDVH